MPAEVMCVPARSCTIYDVESQLAALVNSFDPLADEGDESSEAILAAIGEAVRTALDKRDRTVAFLRHCADQQRFADQEIERIEQRKRHIARVQTALESYLVRIIEEFAEPDRKGVRRLDGQVSSMRIQKNPDSVLIIDPAMVPASLKDAVITLPAYVWEALLQCLSLEERRTIEPLVKKLEFRPDKKAIGAELKAGTDIPGADLAFGQCRLVVS